MKHLIFDDYIPRKVNQPSFTNSLFLLLLVTVSVNYISWRQKHYKINYLDVIYQVIYMLGKKSTKHNF